MSTFPGLIAIFLVGILSSSKLVAFIFFILCIHLVFIRGSREKLLSLVQADNTICVTYYSIIVLPEEKHFLEKYLMVAYVPEKQVS